MKRRAFGRIAWTGYKVALCAAVGTVCYWEGQIVYMGICALVGLHMGLDLLGGER